MHRGAREAAIHVVILRIAPDGSIFWNGEKVDDATLKGRFDDAANQSPQPEIHLEPDRTANYDAVARVLADAQHAGASHIGFTGIETDH